MKRLIVSVSVKFVKTTQDDIYVIS